VLRLVGITPKYRKGPLMSMRTCSLKIPVVEPSGFVVIDTETTGGGAKARVIEIGMVFLSKRATFQGEFSTLVYGDGDSGEWFVKRKHGIRNEDLLDAPRFKELAPQFLEAIKGRILFAHNASFDLAQLNHELARVRRRKISHMGCTIGLGIHLGFGRMSLTEAVENLGMTREYPHVALDDARAAAELLKYYKRHDRRKFHEYLNIQGLS